MVEGRKAALPGAWEKLTCVVEVLKSNGGWCAIPSEAVPDGIRGVLESQAILEMGEAANEEFSRRLRREFQLCQVVRLNEKPGYQSLSWNK